MACRKMNEGVAYARNTESGCNFHEKPLCIAAPAFTDQICEQSGYVMTSLPVLQNRFRFLIFSVISACFKSNIF